ncbi:MAG: Transcription factor WhiB [Candidatus Saccharibacteria bacterium]|nr:Transcription factor WhiB [Candidatus Saccharibacteria bacterium]
MSEASEEIYITPQMPDPAWRMDAQCGPGSADDLYETYQGKRKAQLGRAQGEIQTIGRLCAQCSVVSDCLSEALLRGDTHGIQGGTTISERKVLQGQLKTNGGVALSTLTGIEVKNVAALTIVAAQEATPKVDLPDPKIPAPKRPRAASGSLLKGIPEMITRHHGGRFAVSEGSMHEAVAAAIGANPASVHTTIAVLQRKGILASEKVGTERALKVINPQPFESAETNVR